MIPINKDIALLVLDLDQTVRGNMVSNRRPPNDVGEQFIYPGIAEHLADYARHGTVVRFATNQGGIGAGFFTKEACERVLAETIQLLNEQSSGADHFHPDDIEYCPSTDKRHPDRKPNPGMLLKWMELEGLSTYDHHCVYVGDRHSDRLAAEAAGFEFKWAWDFHPGVPVRPEATR